MQKHLRLILAIAIIPVIIWSGINPVHRETWYAEITLMLVVYIPLILSYSKYRFSNTSYIIFYFWIFLQTIGSHYTFSLVPFDYITELFNFSRNHYDRIAHFAVGMFGYPIAEVVHRSKFITKKSAIMLFSLFAIMSMAAAFEWVEWWFAELAGGPEGANFLGSQGDIWDAQKDILADTLGAIVALVIWWWHQKKK